MGGWGGGEHLFEFDCEEGEVGTYSRLGAYTSVILAEKHDSCHRHSTTSFSENVIAAGKSYQM